MLPLRPPNRTINETQIALIYQTTATTTQQQQQILTALKQNFKKSEHATVWYEIIRQQHTLSNQIQQHLQQAPELSIS